MAMHSGRLIQDQNFLIPHNGSSVGGKTNVLKGKGGLGGRRPLGDLSNSGKPDLNHAPKKQTSSKNLAFIGEESGASQIRNDTSKKKSISKASEKVKTGTRKALSDISNSSKPHLHGASNKNLNQKFSVAAQEALHPIAEENFLHNHQECIKAQTKAMDIDEFLTTVGLDNDHSKCLASPCAAPPVWIKFKPESPLKYFELEEMAELLIEDDASSWKHELSGMPASPPPFKTPRSLNHFTPWKDCDFINFKLMETPEVTKN
ncbi:protein PATRONUS 1 [Quercus suber]|uniref:Protein patronus 1 n=1 Tax=Quercus suber TaxID=58331 RepID=A0AAW0LS13_QUESU